MILLVLVPALEYSTNSPGLGVQVKVTTAQMVVPPVTTGTWAVVVVTARKSSGIMDGETELEYLRN